MGRLDATRVDEFVRAGGLASSGAKSEAGGQSPRHRKATRLLLAGRTRALLQCIADLRASARSRLATYALHRMESCTLSLGRCQHNHQCWKCFGSSWHRQLARFPALYVGQHMPWAVGISSWHALTAVGKGSWHVQAVVGIGSWIVIWHALAVG